MKEIYAPLHSLEIPFVVTNVESSELIKYAANGFLATKISFINEIAQSASASAPTCRTWRSGMGLDSRIGPKFLQAGPGFGGSCFPKDTSRDGRHRPPLRLRRSRSWRRCSRVNDDIKQRMVDKIVEALGGDVDGKTIAILGLAFKPETDDMRDSPTHPDHQGPADARRARSAPTIPQAMENCAADLRRTSPTATTPTRPPRAPTRS